MTALFTKQMLHNEYIYVWWMSLCGTAQNGSWNENSVHSSAYGFWQCSKYTSKCFSSSGQQKNRRVEGTLSEGKKSVYKERSKQSNSSGLTDELCSEKRWEAPTEPCRWFIRPLPLGYFSCLFVCSRIFIGVLFILFFIFFDKPNTSQIVSTRNYKAPFFRYISNYLQRVDICTSINEAVQRQIH